MQRLLLALVPLLLVAGCVGSKADDPPASEGTGLAAADAPVEAAPESEPTPETTEPAPSAPPAANASAPTDERPATQAPPAPAAPEPQPWNLSATARLGWAVAAGARADPVDQAAEQGMSDGGHCPDATVTVPESATLLKLTAVAAFATAGEAEAGAYRLRLTGPDGKVTWIEPPTPQGPDAPVARGSLEDPIAGIWALHAEPIGPVVQQVWDVEIEVEGLALAAPGALVVASAC